MYKGVNWGQTQTAVKCLHTNAAVILSQTRQMIGQHRQDCKYLEIPAHAAPIGNIRYWLLSWRYPCFSFKRSAHFTIREVDKRSEILENFHVSSFMANYLVSPCLLPGHHGGEEVVWLGHHLAMFHPAQPFSWIHTLHMYQIFHQRNL